MQFLAPQSAGIVVIRNFDEEYKVLVLYDKKKFDLPKGHINPAEDFLSAARRETFEEASISNLDFRWGTEYFDTEKSRFFLASTTDDPYIRRNPSSGQFEHLGCSWLSFRSALRSLPMWMRPAIIWAKDTIQLVSNEN